MEPTFVFLIDPERVVSSGRAIVDHGVRVVVDPVGTEDAQRPHAVLELGRGLSKLLRLVPRPRRGLCEDQFLRQQHPIENMMRPRKRMMRRAIKAAKFGSKFEIDEAEETGSEAAVMLLTPTSS